MMGKWRKYRDMWGVEVGRLMRETVEATGAKKLAKTKLAWTPRLAWDKRYLAPHRHAMKSWPWLSSQYIVEKRSRKACRNISGNFRGRINLSGNSGRNA